MILKKNTNIMFNKNRINKIKNMLTYIKYKSAYLFIKNDKYIK